MALQPAPQLGIDPVDDHHSYLVLRQQFRREP